MKAVFFDFDGTLRRGDSILSCMAYALKKRRMSPADLMTAAGAGIYVSILTGATPLNKDAWPIPQQLVARCLNALAAVGGPRCCKRTSRIAIHEAVRFTAERFGVVMPEQEAKCSYMKFNRECIGKACPYFPKEGV